MRRKYIDWARAIAILVMVEAHTLDAWTRASERGSHAFRNLTVLGGFAAPLFLWLAGVALVLSADRTLDRTGSARAAMTAICRRGLEIFVLAFLFRLQAFIVSPGSHLLMLFRVDILNVMGPAIVMAGLVWGVSRRAATRVAAFAAAATTIAMITPLVRAAAWVSALPIWVQWYVRPAGEYTAFTLFPWTAFVFAGAAAGALISAAKAGKAERRLQTALAAVGAALIAIGFATAARPAIYAQTSFWNSSPTYFAIRVGVLMCALAAMYAGERLLASGGIALPRLETLGRSSLFVYWIHVELVYGYATWPLRHHLTLWQLGLAYGVFTVGLYGAVVLRDRVVTNWRIGGPASRSAAAAAA